MLFSATMEQSVAGLVASYVRNPVRIAVEASAETTGQIDFYCYEVARGSKFDLLEYLLRKEKGSFLVFVATKEGADRLTEFLEREAIKVAAIHGDRSQSQRIEALQGFTICRRTRRTSFIGWDARAAPAHVVPPGPS